MKAFTTQSSLFRQTLTLRPRKAIQQATTTLLHIHILVEDARLSSDCPVTPVAISAYTDSIECIWTSHLAS
jgi:hypothetical protein